MCKHKRSFALSLLGTMILSVHLVVSPVIARGGEAGNPQIDCNPPHHTAAPFLTQMVGSDEARIYANMAQTIIIAMKIAECGNRWFFALYYDGKFHTNFFPSEGWSYISKQIGNYGLSLITWRNVFVESITSITVLSIGIFFPTFIFIPWISPGRLYGIPEPTVSAAEFSYPVIQEAHISPIETPSP